MARNRDYKAEYQRRKQRGQALGLTPSQYSGHPKKTEQPASQVIARLRVTQPQRVARAAPPKQQKAAATRLADGYRRGVTAKVRVKTHTKGTQRTPQPPTQIRDAAMWTGQRLGRMQEIINYTARTDPHAAVRITVIDKDGNAHTIYQNGGRSASKIQQSINGGSIYNWLAQEFGAVYLGPGTDPAEAAEWFEENFGSKGDLEWEIVALPTG